MARLGDLDGACYSPGAYTACPAGAADRPRVLERCTLLCGLCTTPDLRLALADPSVCLPGWKFNADTVLTATTDALLTLGSELQGFYWLDEPGAAEVNATAAVSFLLGTMPIRDQQLLFSGRLLDMMDFLFEHVRLALQTRKNWPAAAEVPWDVFLDNVLPFAALDEKRDVAWRARPRFYQLFAANASATASLYEAAVNLAAAMPDTQLLGTLSLDDTPNAGPAVSWKSSTAPAFLSPQQVSTLGGSCTGTALTMLAAFRAVGIPSRIAGCSDEFRDGAWLGDDHHWVEFYDPTVASPFGDGWHTKEGTSKGNAGGPFDAPSSPMNGCLAGLVPGSRMATIWASSWASPTFMPTLWHNSTFAETYAFVGGINRCGAYCSAWGCGANQTDMYAQDECGLWD